MISRFISHNFDDNQRLQIFCPELGPEEGGAESIGILDPVRIQLSAGPVSEFEIPWQS